MTSQYPQSFAQPSAIELIDCPTQLEALSLDKKLASKAEYEKLLAKWQKRMLTVQQAYYRQNLRALIVFEGWDASGKGGAIRRLTEKLDPRGFTVFPIAAPSQIEQSKHYLYRFQTKLPAAGNINIFDRSYYGRVLVERVEQFATEHEWQRAYQEINEFERLLTDDGVKIIKLFLHIDQDEQLKRFQERIKNPNKRWKLTEEDLRNRDKWPSYQTAINDMLKYTSTKSSPWQVVEANRKWYTRVEVLKTIVKALECDVDLTPPALTDDIRAMAKTHLKLEL